MDEPLKSKKIAIIAGGGNLPQSLILELKSRNIPYIVLAIAGNVDAEFLASNKH